MKRLLLLLLVAGLGAGGYYGYQTYYLRAGAAPARAQAPEPGRGVPVEVAKAERATVTDDVEALGTLAADESVVIAPEMSGRVVALGFKEGERVTRGQELVKLDTALLDAELKQAQAELAQSRDTYERNKALVARGAGTQVALEQAANQLAAQEARVELSRAKLAQSIIQAPFTGVVGLRAVGVGDYVPVGKPLITLTNIDPIKVDFRVPEIYLSQVRTGQTIELRVDAVSGRVFTGRIFAIDPVVDVNGRAIKLRAAIPNGDLALKPGLFARVSIIVDRRENVLVVPETAIVPQPTGQAIYIVENGKARRIPVELGKRLPGKVEVVKGLDPDMQIVVAGQMRLREGAQVSIKDRVLQTSALSGATR